MKTGTSNMHSGVQKMLLTTPHLTTPLNNYDYNGYILFLADYYLFAYSAVWVKIKMRNKDLPRVQQEHMYERVGKSATEVNHAYIIYMHLPVNYKVCACIYLYT